MTDPWTARLDASSASGLARTDLLVGAGLYAVAAAILAPVGAVAAALVGSALVALWPGGGAVAGGLVTAAVSAPAVVLFGWWLADVARGSVTYELSADTDGLHVVTRVPGVWSWMPDRWLGAVAAPEPWPAALHGVRRDFRAPWEALRGARVEPHALILDLSAERAVSLALRGADLDAASALAAAIHLGSAADPKPEA